MRTLASMAKVGILACPNCGRESADRFRLCGHCGSNLAPDRPAEEIRRTVTIVTSDWKGSTSLGEKLDAESLRELQTRYFDEMQLVYEAYGGTIEKIIGDAIVAVFGLPTRRDDDPLRGVAAAAESLRTLANLNEQFELAYGVRVVVRTGIASGEVVVGAATAGQHVLTGETVRIATAMEQNAPPGEALLSPSTNELVRGLVDVEAVTPFTPKGMRTSTDAYRLVAVSQEAESRLRESAADEAAAAASRMCSNCGEENPADFAMCGTCGASLARAARAQERRKTVSIVFANPKLASASGAAVSAEVQREVMSRYFEAMRPALEKHGGTVEKFIGDAVMAVFGLPVQHEDDALRATRAALEMLEALAALNTTLAAEDGITVQNQIGVNTGEVIAGDAATGQRLVTGDAVNTAARLEQAAPPQEVLIGELTYRLVRDAAQVEPVEALELKGKAERVAAYRLLSVSGAVEGFHRRQDAPMVGREQEMASLGEILERARDEGAARMATVIADAGTGKSRLIREFVDACGPNSIVLRGRCLPYGEGITFWPLVEAARSAAGIEADDKPEQGIAKLRAMIHDPAVADRIAATIGLTAEQFGVTEIFWATRKMLEQLSSDRTPIWVIDDIHWAEQTLLDLIVHLLDAAEAPLLVLCSSRHDVLETHEDWALRPDSLRLILKPLTDADAGAVVQNLLGRAGISGSVQDRIVRAAEGNPLYVEQMLSMLIDSGSVRMVGDRWEQTLDISEMAIPPTIQALLSSRLDLLAPEERTVIEPAAVIGLEFAEEAVEELTPDEIRREVPVHLEAMTRKQLVRPSGSLNIEDASFRFMHILIKDAAYNGLLKRSRARFHEGFVTWADRVNRERGRSQEFEELNGYHLEQAYRYLGELGPLDDHGHAVGARASVLLASAGRRAQGRGDTPAAVNLLRRAAATRTQTDPERLALLPDLGEALMEQGEFEDAEQVLNEAADAGWKNGNEPLACKATLVNLLVQSFSGVSDESDNWTTLAGNEVERALPVFQAAADFAGLALAWRLRSGVAGTAGRYGEAAIANEQVIAYARQAGNLRLETRGATGLAMTMLYGPTPVPEAIVRCEELADHSSADQRSAAIISAQLCQLYAMQGEFDRARALYTSARATLQDLGAGVLASSTSIDSSRVEMLAGDFPAAERELRRDYEALDAIGERYLLSTVAGLLARAIEAQGRHEEAEAITKKVEEIAAPDDPVEQATWRAIAARILARRREREPALRLHATRPSSRTGG
jgi:class 3 adenylate cyclase/tetratricopeptide (TPR) repeat protein